MQKQVWWYFEFDENGNLRLADKNKFKHRPSDANPDQGNPYTPWYELEDHHNDEHIHIKAINYPMAFKKAKQLAVSALKDSHGKLNYKNKTK